MPSDNPGGEGGKETVRVNDNGDNGKGPLFDYQFSTFKTF